MDARRVCTGTFTIRVKCLFQEMWQRGISWDEELPDDLSLNWQQWCVELLQLHKIVIPRWYGVDMSHTSSDQILHVFCDASEKTYGAVAYIQGQTDEGWTITTLIMSKSRVAPISCLNRIQSVNGAEHAANTNLDVVRLYDRHSMDSQLSTNMETVCRQ